MTRPVFVALLLAVAAVAPARTMVDLTEWTPIQDPPPPGTAFGMLTPSTAVLAAEEPAAPGTDIGYASVNGQDVATSSTGFYFAPSNDLAVAMDYKLAPSAQGTGAIGLRIGEEQTGENSAGIELGFALTTGLSFQARSAVQVGGVDQASSLVETPFRLTGRLFVEYSAASGDVTIGISETQGIAVPSETLVIPGIQQQWNDKPLIFSFYSRSQDFMQADSTVVPMSSTAGPGRFAMLNFEVLGGEPIALVIPEPATCLLVVLSLVASYRPRD